MKKFMKFLGFLLLLAIIALVLYFGFGKGLGIGIGDTKSDGNTKVIIEKEETQEAKNEESKETEEITRDNNLDETEVFAGTILKINVVENDYFYENEKITLEEFVTMEQALDADVVVEVTDDNASLQAYNALLDALKENNIAYVEK